MSALAVISPWEGMCLEKGVVGRCTPQGAPNRMTSPSTLIHRGTGQTTASLEGAVREQGQGRVGVGRQVSGQRGKGKCREGTEGPAVS